MDIVFWIILLVVLGAVVWWVLKRKNTPGGGAPSAATPDSGKARSEGGLSGGSAAASAEAVGTTGLPGAAGFGAPAEPPAPATADEPADPAKSTATPGRQEKDADRPEHTVAGSSAIDPGASAAGATAPSNAPDSGGTGAGERQDADDTEWETQWSEASGSARPAGATDGHPLPAAAGLDAGSNASGTRPVHHAEYTEPHAPTLPGAETAALEEADDAGPAAPAPTLPGIPAQAAPAGVEMPSDAAAAETRDRAQSSALVEAGANHAGPDSQGHGRPLAAAATAAPEATEPSGHLAADEPYGAGSASAATDGSGPDGFNVKGDASAMVYYEEGHPEYDQVRAGVWFESEAHAEAAGFRAPRRRRV